MSNTQLVIRLYSREGAYLVVEAPTRVTYETQAGGYSCAHPSQEGFLVPLELNSAKLTELAEPFTGKYGGHCYGSCGIDESDADVIDRVLAGALYHIDVTVDRSRLKECIEAWIPVLIQRPRGEAQDVPKTFAGFINDLADLSLDEFDLLRGVLTWTYRGSFHNVRFAPVPSLYCASTITRP